ncbi:glycosyltransferase [Aquabacter sp. CN5-332]|uniref:glycosyltransferase family 2 protein n=1 Tax=Aquabacter sp. CN5-332 TaxID=3156608 RepID=UPI0032B56DB1
MTPDTPPPAPTRLSVVICTHNRPDALRQCIAALMAAPEEPGCEFIVVDSASNTETRRAMEDMLAPFPRIVLHRLDQPGLSRARNTGMALSSGEWIAFLDDDTVPAPDWLARACTLIAEVPPACSIIGGAVHPLHPAGMPALPSRWLQLLSIIEEKGEGDRTHAPAVCGANIILRKSHLLEVGGFPERLGRQGLRLLSGEEKFVERRLITLGARLWYSDRLRVQHMIAPDRLQWRWIATRAYWEGISDVIILRLMGTRPGVLKALKVACGAVILGPLSVLPFSGSDTALRFWYDVGWLREFIGGREAGAREEPAG